MPTSKLHALNARRCIFPRILRLLQALNWLAGKACDGSKSVEPTAKQKVKRRAVLNELKNIEKNMKSEQLQLEYEWQDLEQALTASAASSSAAPGPGPSSNGSAGLSATSADAEQTAFDQPPAKRSRPSEDLGESGPLHQLAAMARSSSASGSGGGGYGDGDDDDDGDDDEDGQGDNDSGGDLDNHPPTDGGDCGDQDGGHMEGGSERSASPSSEVSAAAHSSPKKKQKRPPVDFPREAYTAQELKQYNPGSGRAEISAANRPQKPHEVHKAAEQLEEMKYYMQTHYGIDQSKLEGWSCRIETRMNDTTSWKFDAYYYPPGMGDKPGENTANRKTKDGKRTRCRSNQDVGRFFGVEAELPERVIIAAERTLLNAGAKRKANSTTSSSASSGMHREPKPPALLLFESMSDEQVEKAMAQQLKAISQSLDDSWNHKSKNTGNVEAAVDAAHHDIEYRQALKKNSAWKHKKIQVSEHCCFVTQPPNPLRNL